MLPEDRRLWKRQIATDRRAFPITPAAFPAIASTFRSDRSPWSRSAPLTVGAYLARPHAVGKLKRLRGPGESYSDVILALAKGGVGSAVR